MPPLSRMLSLTWARTPVARLGDADPPDSPDDGKFGVKASGEAASPEDILADIARRDAVDSGRGDSPMRPAADAVLLDTTEMTIEQAADAARRIVEAARARWETSR